MDAALARVVDESLRFEYLSGGITPLERGHTTGWRVLPGMMCSQIYQGSDRMLYEGHELSVPTGTLMLMPAGVTHRVDLATSWGQSRWVHVNYYLMNNLDLFSLIDISPLVPPPLGHAVGEAIAAWLTIEQHAGGDALYLSARRHEFGFQLLGLLSPACRVKSDAAEQLEQRRRLQRVIEYMHTHYSEPLARNDLAKLANLSPAQFHRAFQQVIGMAPMTYLRQVRIRQAQQQLLATSLTVAEIAEQVGYTDIFVFSKCFKRSCGISPTDYRATLRELRR